MSGEVRFPPPYGPDFPVGLDCSVDKGRTKQSFANESDINSIMAKFHRTGVLVDPGKISTRKAFFGDVSGVVDFQTLQDTVLAANENFRNLPSEIRTRFGNNPGKLISFLEDADNLDEAVELGIVDAPPEPVVDPPVVPPAPVVPPVPEV